MLSQITLMHDICQLAISLNHARPARLRLSALAIALESLFRNALPSCLDIDFSSATPTLLPNAASNSKEAEYKTRFHKHNGLDRRTRSLSLAGFLNAEIYPGSMLELGSRFNLGGSFATLLANRRLVRLANEQLDSSRAKNGRARSRRRYTADKIFQDNGTACEEPIRLAQYSFAFSMQSHYYMS